MSLLYYTWYKVHTGDECDGNGQENSLFPKHAGDDTEISGTVSGLSSEICGCAVSAIGEGITGTQGVKSMFIFEDRYGLKIDQTDGEVCLEVDVRR